MLFESIEFLFEMRQMGPPHLFENLILNVFGELCILDFFALQVRLCIAVMLSSFHQHEILLDVLLGIEVLRVIAVVCDHLLVFSFDFVINLPEVKVLFDDDINVRGRLALR